MTVQYDLKNTHVKKKIQTCYIQWEIKLVLYQMNCKEIKIQSNTMTNLFIICLWLIHSVSSLLFHFSNASELWTQLIS